jgi:hypothetical protein
MQVLFDFCDIVVAVGVDDHSIPGVIVADNCLCSRHFDLREVMVLGDFHPHAVL